MGRHPEWILLVSIQTVVGKYKTNRQMYRGVLLTEKNKIVTDLDQPQPPNEQRVFTSWGGDKYFPCTNV